MNTKKFDSIREIHRLLIGVCAAIVVFGLTPDSISLYKDARSELSTFDGAFQDGCMDSYQKKVAKALFSEQEKLEQIEEYLKKQGFVFSIDCGDTGCSLPVVVPLTEVSQATVEELRDYFDRNDQTQAWQPSGPDLEMALSQLLQKNQRHVLTALSAKAVRGDSGEELAQTVRTTLEGMSSTGERLRKAQLENEASQQAVDVESKAFSTSKSQNFRVSRQREATWSRDTKAAKRKLDVAVVRHRVTQMSVKRAETAVLESKEILEATKGAGLANLDVYEEDELLPGVDPRFFLVTLEVRSAPLEGTKEEADWIFTNIYIPVRAIKKMAKPEDGSLAWYQKKMTRSGAVDTPAAPFFKANSTDLWSEIGRRRPKAAEVFLQSKIDSRTQKIPLAGIEIHETTLSLFGLPIIGLVLAFLWAHMRHLVDTLGTSSISYPWIGLYRDKLSVGITLATVLVGPVGVAVWLFVRSLGMEDTWVIIWSGGWLVASVAAAVFCAIYNLKLRAGIHQQQIPG